MIDFSQLQIQGVFDFLLSLSLSVQLCSSSIFIAQNIIYTRHTEREREFDQRLPGWHIYIFGRAKISKFQIFSSCLGTPFTFEIGKKGFFFRFALGKMIIFFNTYQFFVSRIEYHHHHQDHHHHRGKSIFPITKKENYISFWPLVFLFVHSFIFSIFIGFCSRWSSRMIMMKSVGGQQQQQNHINNNNGKNCHFDHYHYHHHYP